jgi:hypothetical protein
MKNYNGYTNYETWRVSLEMFEGITFEEKVEVDYLKEMAQETIQLQGAGLALDYALFFLDSVNWYEIADNINKTFALNE